MDRSALLALLDKFEADVSTFAGHVSAGLRSLAFDLQAFRLAVEAAPPSPAGARLNDADLDAIAFRVQSLGARVPAFSGLVVQSQEPGRLELVQAAADAAPPLQAEPEPAIDGPAPEAPPEPNGEAGTAEEAPAVGRLELVAASAELAPADLGEKPAADSDTHDDN